MPHDSTATTSTDSLRQALADRYRVERELGGGGMSFVFLATEIALGRRVVIKVLAAERTGPLAMDRFAREIQMAATLQQANIVPLLSAGEAGGLPYYTMPFVEGEALRQRLARGDVFGASEAVEIARDVARALSYAHAKGVVHRDIKPDNILLSHGTAVVTDFGIAKALSAAKDSAANATLTQAGAAIGTPAYMAPEQIMADPDIGPAADLYALGCVMYELLGGRRPFERDDPKQVMVGHLFDAPDQPLAALRPDIPVALVALVERCMAKDANDRPASADDLLRDLSAVITGGGGTPPEVERPDAATLEAARTRALATALGEAPRQSPRRLRLPVVIAVAIAVVAVTAWGLLRTGSARRGDGSLASVAVLPFVDHSPGGADQYLGDGIAETLIATLSREPGITVTARTSAFALRGKDVDVRAIGRRLGVGTVLEGSVQRAGDQLRVTAELARTADGTSLWSATFDHPASEIFAIQDEVVRAVGQALGAQVDTALARRAATPTGQAATYDIVLRARHLVTRRTTSDVETALSLLRQAIAADSNFAPAWASLAEGSVLHALYSNVPAGPALDEAHGAAARALRIDPQAPDALAIRAYLLFLRDWNPVSADSAFRSVLAAQPKNVLARKWHADVLDALGRHGEAWRALNEARASDPLSAIIATNVARELLASGDTSGALAKFHEALGIEPGQPLALRDLSRLVYERGDSGRFLTLHGRLVESSDRAGAPAATLRLAWQRGGQREVARAQVTAFTRESLPWERAYWRAQAGDIPGALRDLDEAVRVRDAWVAFLGRFPVAAIRRSPSFAALIRRAGLPPIVH